MRLIHRNASTLENSGDELTLWERPNDRGSAIDDGVRYASDAELIREPRELIRLDADGPYLRRRQRHPVGQAHGPGTVRSSRRGEDQDLGGLGQSCQRSETLVTQAMICSRDSLDGFDQCRELGSGCQTLKPDARRSSLPLVGRVGEEGVGGSQRDRGDVVNPIGARALRVASDIDLLQRDLLRRGVSQ